MAASKSSEDFPKPVFTKIPHYSLFSNNYYSINDTKEIDNMRYIVTNNDIEELLMDKRPIHWNLFIQPDMKKQFMDRIDLRNIVKMDGSFYRRYEKYYPKSIQKDLSNNTIRSISLIQNELGYLDLMRRILATGSHCDKERTSIGTLMIPNQCLRFSLLDDQIPLLTTKNVPFRWILEELLFFITGGTQTKYLEDRGVTIWKADTAKDKLEARGLDYPEGCYGPSYGYQWRHSGQEYFGPEKDYTGLGFDQLAWLINEIKSNIQSRRLTLSAAHAADYKKMTLPPCHPFFGINYNPDDDMLYSYFVMRSVDYAVGLPFNIVSYSLLTRMIGFFTGKKCAEITVFTGNTHIYKNHIENCHEMLKRDPFNAPKLHFINTDDIETIDDFRADHFELVDYQSHPTIHFELNVGTK